MPKPLIIVESFAKVKTLKAFLRGEYDVLASGGHVRDLPEDKLGVKIEAEFEPDYYVLPGKEKTIRRIAEAVEPLRHSSNGLPVLLATDPDREGEAIAWHLSEALELGDAQRIEFNEITRSAVLSALDQPRSIDINRVNAQQARRIIDRIVGYYLSPLLWKRGGSGLSAGRVQSVALRMICEREREIEAFVPQEYWTITAVLRPKGSEETFEAQLVAVGPEEAERFDSALGAMKSGEAARAMIAVLEDASFRVAEVEVKEETRNPWPPFITSTLQQGAWYRLRLSSYRTMRLAQELYQGVKIGKEGSAALITYIRTDSVRVASQAIRAARQFIGDTFGGNFLPDSPRQYRVKATAQDAHEAIRPTDVKRTPDSLRVSLGKEEWALYDLIWRRFLASQMAGALYERTRVEIEAANCVFRAKGSKLLFEGFLAVEGRDDEDKLLPALEKGQVMELVELSPEQHFTEPPPRYNEASLVKALEENGIGRPSTYAPTLATLRQREYVWTERRHFRPTSLGFAVNDFLVENFTDVVNVEFTAKMESELDEVERGGMKWNRVLSEFYEAFEPLVKGGKEFTIAEQKCPKCGRPLALRSGKFGRFYGCTGYPECKYLMPVKPREPVVIVEGKSCPKCGSPLARRRGKFGTFIGCTGYPDCDYIERRGKSPAEPEQPEATTEGKVCPQCGRPLGQRRGRYGTFIGCTGYPECNYIERTGKASAQSNPTDIPCPVAGCGGRLVRRKSARGYFYGCSNYPDCRYTSSEEPTDSAEAPGSKALTRSLSKGTASKKATRNRAAIGRASGTGRRPRKSS